MHSRANRLRDVHLMWGASLWELSHHVILVRPQPSQGPPSKLQLLIRKQRNAEKYCMAHLEARSG